QQYGLFFCQMSLVQERSRAFPADCFFVKSFCCCDHSFASAGRYDLVSSKPIESAGSKVSMVAAKIVEQSQPGRGSGPHPLALDEIAAHHLMDEQRLVERLLERAIFTEDQRRRAADTARRLVLSARAKRGEHAGVDAFMREYGLSSEEGVILMCIAE